MNLYIRDDPNGPHPGWAASSSRLPGEDDPVPGGMYPDDWDREDYHDW